VTYYIHIYITYIDHTFSWQEFTSYWTALTVINFFWPVNVSVGKGSSECEKLLYVFMGGEKKVWETLLDYRTKIISNSQPHVRVIKFTAFHVDKTSNNVLRGEQMEQCLLKKGPEQLNVKHVLSSTERPRNTTSNKPLTHAYQPGAQHNFGTVNQRCAQCQHSA
jgi:hypothetical protein